MKPLQLGLAGSTGRMGQEVKAIISEEPAQWALCFTLGRGSARADGKAHSPPLDVMIDFSTQAFFSEVLAQCVANGWPLVSGTTGLTEQQITDLSAAAQSIPIVYAANMSLGVALLNKMIKQLAELEGFDFAIEEIHHRHKLDQPSGTALHLQKTLQAAMQAAMQAAVQEAVQAEVPVVSLRGGGVFGVHRVLALGSEETLCLEHSALNRRVFARGALRAARWVHSQTKGLYGIADLLGDKN